MKKSQTNPVMLALTTLVVMVVIGAYTAMTSTGPDDQAYARATIPDQFTLTASEVATARDELAQLAVAEKGSMDTYDRDAFGKAWDDGADGVAFAGNGCDTRNDVLARDLTEVKREGDCTVLSGRLWNPYGVPDNPYEHYIDFQRGKATSSAVQIDHVVALANVWVSGGDRLTAEQRLAVANDPINLVAVDGPQNGAKGDKDASQWLPANDRIHCFYAASQVRVKVKYALTVTPAERDTLSGLIDSCPAGV